MATEPIHPLKACSKCSILKPLDEDHFSFRSGKALARCKDCARAYDRERYARDPEKRKANTIRAQRRHREAYRERHKRWRDANPDKVKAQWVRNYSKNKENHLAKNKRWRDENPEKRRACRRRRSAREYGASGNHTAEDIQRIAERQKGACFYCATKPESLEVDHFIPLVRGGSNGPENLVLSCRPCNRQKNAKLPWEWRPDLFSPVD